MQVADPFQCRGSQRTRNISFEDGARNDWSEGGSLEVSGLTCLDVEIPSKGSINYQRFEVWGSADGGYRLYVGDPDTGDGTTPHRRPNDVSIWVAFDQQ